MTVATPVTPVTPAPSRSMPSLFLAAGFVVGALGSFVAGYWSTLRGLNVVLAGGVVVGFFVVSIIILLVVWGLTWLFTRPFPATGGWRWLHVGIWAIFFLMILGSLAFLTLSTPDLVAQAAGLDPGANLSALGAPPAEDLGDPTRLTNLDDVPAPETLGPQLTGLEAIAAAEPLEVAALAADLSLADANLLNRVSGPVVGLCDNAAVEDQLRNEETKFIEINMERDFPDHVGGTIMISMDSGLLIYGGGTDLTNAVDTVYGAVVGSQGPTTIVTRKGSSAGLGWNTENGRYNARICAYPAGMDIERIMYDLQLKGWVTADDLDGEGKPVGVFFADRGELAGQAQWLWTPENPIDLVAVYARYGITPPVQ